MHRTALAAAMTALAVLPSFAQPAASAVSVMDWQTEQINSVITLDTALAGIELPTGRSTAISRLDMEIPNLLKDTFFSLVVDSANRLGDIVETGSVSLQDLDDILEAGRKTPPAFSRDLTTLSLHHTVSVAGVGSLFIRHNSPYSPERPLERTATRAYTGIIVDARGPLSVRGEFISDSLKPSLFPKLWDESMNLLYEKNMVEPRIARERGIVHYAASLEEAEASERIGSDPLRVVARGVYGINRTDPLLSRQDALKILSQEENLKLLREGRVVIVCDGESLEPKPLGPERDGNYWFVWNQIERQLSIKPVTGMDFSDAWKGMKLTMYDLRFVADAARILPEERERIDGIAAALKQAGPLARFVVEGHTASVGKPAGELELSILRSVTVAEELARRGIPRERISTAGYGGTRPVAGNDSEEGRALNRRVEITINLDESP